MSHDKKQTQGFVHLYNLSKKPIFLLENQLYLRCVLLINDFIPLNSLNQLNIVDRHQ